jgi:hypothetical protein
MQQGQVKQIWGIVILIGFWGLIASPGWAQGPTRVDLEGMGDPSVQQRAETNASEVLTALNRAVHVSRDLAFEATSITEAVTEAGERALREEWSRAPFDCPESRLRGRLVRRDAGGYLLRGIPQLIRNQELEVLREQEGILFFNESGQVDGFVFQSEYQPPVSPAPPSEEEPATGTLFIETEPSGATVTSATEGTARLSPARFRDHPAGDHAFTIRSDDYQTLDTTLTVQAGQSTTHTIRLTPAFGFLSVTGIPEGSTVRLNGDEQPASEMDSLHVPVGQHTLSVEKRYFEPWEQTVRVVPGALETVEVRLQRMRVPLRVESVPSGAIVEVDRTPVGTTPLDTTVAAGRSYALTLEKQGFVPSAPREVVADAPIEQKIVLNPFEVRSEDGGVQLANLRMGRGVEVVRIQYDLDGSADEKYTVRLVRVGPGGEEVVIDKELASGDLGTDLSAGPEKRITWRDDVPEGATIRLVVDKQGGSRMRWVWGSVAAIGGGAAVAVLAGLLSGGGGDEGFADPPGLPSGN